jgi:hypothetical protein
MANAIRIRRRAAGGAAGAPSTLLNAELAFNEQDDILYYGKGVSGNNAQQVIAIAGPGGYTTLTTAQTISGNKTFTGTQSFTGATITVPTLEQTDNSTNAASTAYVRTAISNVAVSDATTTTKGIASFDSGDFSVTSGAVSIKTGGVDNSQLANSSITINGSAISLGGSVSNLALTTGNLSQFASTTSSQLLGVISDETGTGSLVFANTPTLVTPVLGAATATSITASSTDLTIAAAAGNNNVILSPTGTGAISASSKRIINVATPVLLTDAVNKEYADAIASSLNIHGSVQVATIASVSYTYTGGGTALTINSIATNVITFSANHGLKINSQILANATSNGLTSGTTYYVVSIPNLNQVTVSTTPGGTTHTLTDGTGLNISVTGDQGVGATLTGTPNTVDGYSLVLNDGILVKNHTTGAYNGVYKVTTVGTGSNGVWTRREDADNSPTGELSAGDYFFVASGGTLANTSWTQTTQGPIIVGTTSIAYTQFGSAGTITAGDGLTKTGDTLNVGGTTNRISVSADSIDISASYVGQTSITTLGTIGTGTWNGGLIGATYGGTGVNNGSNTITIGGNVSIANSFTTSGAFALTLTATGTTNVTLPAGTKTLVATDVATLSSLTSIGTITTGTWNGSVIGATYGGTGVNNGSSTLTMGGSVTFSGAFTTSLTVTAATSVTLPTSGTLLSDGSTIDGGTF